MPESSARRSIRWLAAWSRKGGWLPLSLIVANVAFAAWSLFGGDLVALAARHLIPLLSIGGLVCWIRAFRSVRDEPRIKIAVGIAMAGMVTVAAPDALYWLAESTGLFRSILSAASILGFFIYPLVLVAVLAWPAIRRPGDAWGYFLVDLAMVVLGASLLLWHFNYGPSGTAASYSAVYVAQLGVGIALIVGLSIAILRGSPPEWELPFRLLVTAGVAACVTNLGLSIIEPAPPVSGLINLAMSALVTTSLIGAAEGIRLRWLWPRKTPAPASASPIPILSVGSVALLMLDLGLREQRSGLGPIVIGAIAMTVLLLVRQVLTMRQNARLLAERAAHESDRKIAALVKHTSDVILITDQEFKIRFISPSAESLWTGDPHRFLGTDIRDMVDPVQLPEVDQALQSRLMRPGQSLATRWRVAGSDGAWRLVEAVIANLLYEPTVNGVVFTLRDYTERVRLEERLHQAQKMEAVGQLAGGIAHDFNNLLTTILGHSEMGLDSLEPENPVRDDLEQIKRASEMAASLTKQLLAFSRKQIVEPKVIDVSESIAQIAKLLKRLIEENVRTVLQVQPETGRVKMDPSQLEQVVLNLAINARDAMPHGGTLMIAAHRERVMAEIPGVIPVAPNDYLVIEVSDTGVGMDPETQRRIFEPFFTTKPPGRGTGLGLASVYGIVTQNRGGLLLRSAPGQGSTFSVYLPRIESLDAVTTATTVPVPGSSVSGTILLVEDEPWLRDLARKVLTKEGYQVLVAGDALEARAIAHGAPKLDLLLTDVVMPGLSGPKLAAQLRRERPGLRVLYMSGYPGGELTSEMAPNERLLRKPFAPHVLLEFVRAALEETVV